jgi:uncharacterized protein
MPTYSTPGVYVTETALASLTTTTSGLSAASFFGEAARGPLGPVLVNDWASYKQLFGDIEDQYDLGYAVFHYFANGGRSCYVVRVVNASTTTAARAQTAYYPDGTGSASANLFVVTAISPGTWGNTVTFGIENGTVPASASELPTFNLVVYLSGGEVERWNDLSLDPNNSRYAATVVNNYSNFVRISSLATPTPDVDFEYSTATFALSGASVAPVVDADYVTALTYIDQVEGNLILNAVGSSSPTVIGALINKAATRGDSFVIVDPDAADQNLSDLQSTASNFSGLSNGGYAAQYVPMLKMIDPAKTGPGAIRDTYPGGAVAGLYVRSEVERTVAKAPAGFAADIRGALGTVLKLTDTQVGQLYDGSPQVNTFKVVPGAGVTVNGARTFQRRNPDKYVSVRRTLNYLKYSLKKQSEFALFEPNDERLWNQINVTVSNFLTQFWRSGGLKGARAADAFFVICDSTNNTPSTIDQGIVNIQVGVALTYPAEFVVITLSQWTGGSNTVETF